MIFTNIYLQLVLGAGEGATPKFTDRTHIDHDGSNQMI